MPSTTPVGGAAVQSDWGDQTLPTITGSSEEGGGAVWGILNSPGSAKYVGSNSDSVGVLGGLNELLLRNAWHMTAWKALTWVHYPPFSAPVA